MTAVKINTYPRETVEFQAIEVTVDGVPVTVFDYALTRDGIRPATWSTPITVSGRKGFLVTGPPGLYTVWVRYTSNPETPVVEAGQIQIS